MKLKVCCIISLIEFSRQFIDIDNITDSDKYELSYIFLSPQIPTLQKVLGEKGRATRFVEYRSKRDLPRAAFQISKYLGQLKPDIVHTHLVDASLAGLVAAKLKKIKKRIHTRHHSIENYIYHPHGTYYDKIINHLSEKIIAVSSVVANVLIEKEKVTPRKVTVVEHGFKFEDYVFSPEKVKELKIKYGLSAAHPVIGVISRFTHGKGLQFIIPAFKELIENYPQAKLVLANARGDYSDEIKQILSKNLDASQYVLIEFEKNFVELYKMFDVFIHAPISREFEAFGQTYIESLALGIPSVFTLSGIANDFIVDGKNALVVDFCNSEMIARAVEMILENTELREKLIVQGKLDIEKRFHIGRMVDSLDKVYSGL